MRAKYDSAHAGRSERQRDLNFIIKRFINSIYTNSLLLLVVELSKIRDGICSLLLMH